MVVALASFAADSGAGTVPSRRVSLFHLIYTLTLAYCFAVPLFDLVARHVYGYTKVLDGDGDPDRPDNYAPIHNV